MMEELDEYIYDIRCLKCQNELDEEYIDFHIRQPLLKTVLQDHWE